MSLSLLIFFFFFFNDTATTEIYTLSLHDALPIFVDLNDALAKAGLASRVVAGQVQGRLTLALAGAARGSSLEIGVAVGDPASTVLHFADGQQAGSQASAFPLGNLVGVARITGLTLHAIDDADWFTLTLAAAGSASDQIELPTLQGTPPTFH